MASNGGGGTSDKSAKKQLGSNKVCKLFSGVLISDLITDAAGEGVVLTKTNKTLLGVVAEETAVKLGGTVSKPFGAPSMRYLLRTLGLCRVDIDLPSTDKLLDRPYKVDVALRLATGSNTALWRIIKDYRFVCEMLARPTPNSPSRVAWASLTGAVFTVLEPADQATPKEEGKKGKPLSEAAERKRNKRLGRLRDLTKLLGTPELMDKSQVEGAEGEPLPPLLANKDTHWLVPGRNRALYCLLLSTTLRRRQGGEAELVPPDPTRELRCGLPPQAYLYMRRLSETLPPADQDAALEEDAKAEQELLEEHRNLLPEDPVEGGGGAAAAAAAASAAPPVPAPLVALLPHAAALKLLKHDTPVAKYMLSEPHRPQELRVWEGVYGLLGVLSDGRLVFVRDHDHFELLSNDGDVPFSRLGCHLDLPEGFAGSCSLRTAGQRAGRLAVCSEVASPFKAQDIPEGMPCEREGRRLVFDPTGTQLLGKLDEQGQMEQVPDLDEALHAALQTQLNTHQVPKARLSDPGWLMDFHQAAATPLPPTEERANTGLAPDASVNMQLETGGGGGAAEGRGTVRTWQEAESDPVVLCRNRLTSGDLASLVMVHYLWSDVVTTPQTPNPLDSLPVVLDMPKILLTGLLGDASLAERVYQRLLRPSGGSEVFFLQDLLTVFNGCGWAGQLKQDVDTFIRTRWTALLPHMPEDALLPLPAARAQPCTPPTGPLAYITMSTSEPMTLSLHYVGKGGEDEQHARIDYDDTATGAKAFIVDLPPKIQDMLAERGVDLTNLRKVVEALRTNLSATKEVMREGATMTDDATKYHRRGKNKGQEGQQPKRKPRPSGVGFTVDGS